MSMGVLSYQQAGRPKPQKRAPVRQVYGLGGMKINTQYPGAMQGQPAPMDQSAYNSSVQAQMRNSFQQQMEQIRRMLSMGSRLGPSFYGPPTVTNL